jgi:alkylation response protein AidB-like acyl-CoA dehydrogenase
MPNYKAPVQDFRFLIEHFLDLDAHADVPGFAAAKELVTPLLEASAQLCEEVLFPLNRVGDQQGLKYKDGTVTSPEGFKEAYKTYCEGGWPTLTWPSEYGGQDLPEFLNMPMLEMVCSANLSFGLTPGLTHGAIHAILLHGSEAQKQTYLPNMISGKWSGVMCLTEPVAGTDLGLMKTRAEPQADGSYKIIGNKIFISAGEQDQSENIIHLVLARLPDAPKGTKGISLFLVPKFIPPLTSPPQAGGIKEGAQESSPPQAEGKEGGNISDISGWQRNAFSCASIEHKMGIHASPTCVMNYDGATGWLVGAPHRGLPAMFTMMNTARLYVGVQGLGVGEAAYQNALMYAKDRLQGRALTGAKFPEKPADPITVHPDVRRMLYTMKSFCEGARALTLEVALHSDLAHRHPDAAARQEADDFVQLMTPILKASLTDGGFDTASTAMQVFGGYGYIEEYGASQYLRDARIAMIYEGTNGIQAMDLVGRKLPYETGRYLRAFFHPVDRFIAAHRNNPAMAEFTKPLKTHLKYLQQATLWVGAMGLANPNHAGAAAVEYQKMFALVVYAYLWAKQVEVVLRMLGKIPASQIPPLTSPPLAGGIQGTLPPQAGGEGGGNSEQILGGNATLPEGIDREFLEAKLATARFYFAKILPGTTSLLAAITAGADTVMAEGL